MCMKKKTKVTILGYVYEFHDSHQSIMIESLGVAAAIIEKILQVSLFNLMFFSKVE